MNLMKEEMLLYRKKIDTETLKETLELACKKIAPVWPLEHFVAVNPYQGIADQSFGAAAQQLSQLGGINMTLPISFYLEKIAEGIITKEDIKQAISKHTLVNERETDFINRVKSQQRPLLPDTTLTMLDVASRVDNKDYNRLMIARISAWASSYFDNGQAQWSAADTNLDLYEAWRLEAENDLTPEIAGLKEFRKTIKSFPKDYIKATQLALDILFVPQEGLDSYLHSLLLKMGGWAAHAARLDWEARLNGQESDKTLQFLAILVSWEATVYQCQESAKLFVSWLDAKKRLEDSSLTNETLADLLILQEAFDIAAQKSLISKINKSSDQVSGETYTPKAQAIFCIDVRSEVYRRNLELVDNQIDTLGFAGFFAFPISFTPLAHTQGIDQCPVLIKSGPKIKETISEEVDRTIVEKRVLRSSFKQIWKSFKSGAVTCFSFVSPLGITYLPKLISDSFGFSRPVPHPYKMSMSKSKIAEKSVQITQHEQMGLSIDQQVQMAYNALKAMSLTADFADFVLIVGHGATSVNNPHASGLDCGACGGHSGEPNAKVAAAILNEAEVRTRLKDLGIDIPKTTTFLACLHDTTTDIVSIFNEYAVPNEKITELESLKISLQKAGEATRTERAVRMSINGPVSENIFMRSRDWSQVRPEWGLAGCSNFIVASRKRTKHLDLGGQSFLHSYESQLDTNYSVLELIMTAPMVVTSWINLQYYASTVDNKVYGAGNKTLHNVTGGLGVLEGFSGDLRIGLPMQSVHDGIKYQHEPLRLNVVIEAPIDAMNNILEKHQNVKALCDNQWIFLFAMDKEGKISHQYTGDLNWGRVQ
ncbi:YbcC family protein [Penaeicola halotolerans]|uniref:YbcC family protein n=1 Tax=Penaeicola halotolerans TaxID=2793196 RepID=UPI001CF8B18C|nr:DUF2309 domain-containing protein [Penaeicola halotolerans]